MSPEQADSNGTSQPPTSHAVGRLRGTIPRWQMFAFSLLCMALVLAVWWFLTRGETSEERIVSRVKLPSPAETFGTFKSLWFDRALTRNTFASVRRVVLGFCLATVVGVPLGVWCGCFPRVAAFFAPLNLFGRNIPMAALIPLSLMLFGIDELQKVMFIFIAAVAFIISDSAQAVRDVADRYVDTAFTLGASRRQTILKVLVPLALPNSFNSLRLLFGLAFGYIMLAEVVQTDGASGLGGIINISMRRGPKEHIYLVLLLIPMLAFAMDRVLFWIQKQLFPYKYGGEGLLAGGVKLLIRGWEAVKENVRVGPANAEYEEVLAQALATASDRGAMSPNADPQVHHLLRANMSASDMPPPAASSPIDAVRDVGLGHVLDHVRSAKELARPPVVEFRHVTKTYHAGQPNAFTAIRDVDFVVEDLADRGEFVAILGPSGCGKSTVLRLIAGLHPQHPATSGQVLTGGNRVAGPGADRGMVFQDYTSFDHRTVLENVTFGPECQGVRRSLRKQLGRWWIDRVGLNVNADQHKYPHQLSGGMRQRVAIARTLILRPKIILMDEPFGALDPNTRMNMQDLLVSLWREIQATVFFVTHSIEEAVYLGDRIYLLTNSPGTMLEELDVDPPDMPAREMQRDPRFQETVYYIRDRITRMEQESK